MRPDLSWQDDAVCRSPEVNPVIFFPVEDKFIATAQTKAAKQVCAGCPARRACLQFALRYPQVGIWGGMTEHERRTIRRTA